ncbi:MAG: DUF3426 domain-containing protein [Pseudomonadota bacterium]
MSDIVLTCPACATRYKSSADSLGPNGRTVRCAKCGEVWFQPAPDLVPHSEATADALALQDNESDITSGADASTPHPAPVPPAPEPEPVPVTPPRETVGGDLLKDTVPTEPKAPIAPEAPIIPDTPGADVMMRDRADQIKLARRKRTILFIWLVPLIIVLLAAIIAWTQRQAIVNRIPQMATLYQAIGADVRVGGLKLDPPTARMMVSDGLPIVRIDSVLHNLTKETLPVPLIELTLHDENGQSLAQWYVEPSETEIAAKSEIAISTDYAEPPEGAIGVRYRLMNGSAGV